MRRFDLVETRSGRIAMTYLQDDQPEFNPAFGEEDRFHWVVTDLEPEQQEQIEIERQREQQVRASMNGEQILERFVAEMLAVQRASVDQIIVLLDKMERISHVVKYGLIEVAIRILETTREDELLTPERKARLMDELRRLLPGAESSSISVR